MEEKKQPKSSIEELNEMIRKSKEGKEEKKYSAYRWNCVPVVGKSEPLGRPLTEEEKKKDAEEVARLKRHFGLK